MNKKIIFWWSLWTMALIGDEYWMLVSGLINCKVHTAKQFKSWKKEQQSAKLALARRQWWVNFLLG